VDGCLKFFLPSLFESVRAWGVLCFCPHSFGLFSSAPTIIAFL